MNELSTVVKALDEHLRTITMVRETLGNRILEVGAVLSSTLAGGGTSLWCGNGGSAGDSQHLAAEFSGRFRFFFLNIKRRNYQLSKRFPHL